MYQFAAAAITKHQRRQKFVFSHHFLEAGSPRSRCGKARFLLKPFPWACCVPTQPFLCACPSQGCLSLSKFLLLIRTPVKLDEGPLGCIAFTEITSFKTLSPSIVIF